MEHMNKSSIHTYSIPRILWFILISIIISLFIIYIYDYKYNYNTLMFIILVSFMILSILISKDLFHPFNIFFISTQFLFVFNMIDINANKNSFRYGYLDSNYHDKAFLWAVLVILIWYIFMYSGYFYSSRTKTKKTDLALFDIKNTNLISILLIIIGITSYSYVVFLKGGFSGIIESLSGRVSAYAGLNYLIKLTGLVTIGALILLRNGYKKISVIIILLSFLLLASFGGRGGAFFGSIFPYIIYYHYQENRLRILQLVPLGAIVILFSIGLGNYRMYQETRLNFNGFYDVVSKIAHSTQGGEILPSLVGSLIKGDIGYQYGATLINIIFAPIPRSIWFNKPPIDESGIVGKVLMGSEYWGLPPGPYGIAFFNFGFIGVILFSFIVGFIIYKLYYKFVISNTKGNIGLIFYILIISSTFNFISTSAQINLLWYIFIFIVIKLLDVLITSMREPSSKPRLRTNEISVDKI